MIKKYISKALFLPILFISTWLSAQDSTKTLNRRYKHELGIDCRGILFGGGGGVLVYKIRDDRGSLVPIGYAKNWRFQLDIRGNVRMGTKITNVDSTLVDNSQILAPEIFRIQPMVGRERIDFFGRFSMLYGVDIGPYLYYHQNFDSYWNDWGGNSWFAHNYYGRIPFVSIHGSPSGHFTNDMSEVGIVAKPFFGMKYRFSERFSVSIESAFNIGYYFQKVKWKIFNPKETVILLEVQSQGINFHMEYLRLLTFNYHFKKY